MAIDVNYVSPSHGMRDKPMRRQRPDDIDHLTVSENRQITIPKRFHDKLKIDNKLICELYGDEIVLRTEPLETDFSEDILKDLVKDGYNGQELIREFQNRKAQIRPAVEKLIAESEQAAQRMTGTGDEETEELFGDIRE